MKRVLAFSALSAAATLSIGLLIRQLAIQPANQQQDDPPAPPPAAAVRLPERAQRPTLPRLVAPPPQAAAPEQAKGPPPGPPDPSDTGPGSARAHVDFVQQKFRTEARDASWSERSASELEAAFTKKLPTGSRLVSLDCRTTMCRAELYHPSLADFQRVVDEGFGAFGWKGPWMAALVEAPDGRGSGTVAYLGRDGTRLPMPEAQ